MVRVEFQCALVSAHVIGIVMINTLTREVNVCYGLAVINIMARGLVHVYI